MGNEIKANAEKLGVFTEALAIQDPVVVVSTDVQQVKKLVTQVVPEPKAPTKAPTNDGGLNGGEIAAIVICVLMIVFGVVLAVYWFNNNGGGGGGGGGPGYKPEPGYGGDDYGGNTGDGYGNGVKLDYVQEKLEAVQ